MATTPENEQDLDAGKPVQVESVGEYGVEQLMASEEAIEQAREHSGYHFSQDQLDHKGDAIESPEQKS